LIGGSKLLQEIEKLINQSKLKSLSSSKLEDQIEQLLGEEYSRRGGYDNFERILKQLCAQGVLEPVKASGTNGRNPLLYNRYRKVSQCLEQGLRLNLINLHSLIRSAAYSKSPQAYSEDQRYLLALDAFLKDPHQRESLGEAISVNERSFQIFNDEKFLLSDRGRIFLQRIGSTLTDLSCYITTEPFFYMDYRSTGNKLNTYCFPDLSYTALIVENKDTFYSIKRSWQAGKRSIGGVTFDLLIYGEGRKIVGSFAFAQEIPDLVPETMRVYYFGDLDPEGIDIFGSLVAAFPLITIEPFAYCYQALIRLYGRDAPLRREKDQKLRAVHEETFLTYFTTELSQEIQALIRSKRYIPQEGLSYAFFAQHN
jgi:hypothetical protein